MHIGMPMEDMLSAVVFREDEGEVLRQASAVVGRPVVLWEIIGPHQAVPRASSGPDVGARPPGFDLSAILHIDRLRDELETFQTEVKALEPRVKALTGLVQDGPKQKLEDLTDKVSQYFLRYERVRAEWAYEGLVVSDWGAVACVLLRPGSTAFAVMPSFATSFAKPLMNPMIPIFVAM